MLNKFSMTAGDYRALDLPAHSKGLVDIRTDKIWFETKDTATQPLVIFAQLLVYVRAARLRGEPIPPLPQKGQSTYAATCLS